MYEHAVFCNGMCNDRCKSISSASSVLQPADSASSAQSLDAAAAAGKADGCPSYQPGPAIGKLKIDSTAGSGCFEMKLGAWPLHEAEIDKYEILAGRLP